MRGHISFAALAAVAAAVTLAPPAQADPQMGDMCPGDNQHHSQ
jgi:hypothetical protein